MMSGAVSGSQLLRGRQRGQLLSGRFAAYALVGAEGLAREAHRFRL